jgi:hypothetical protein
MAQQYINIGTTPNDGTGDVMRVSFTKTDNNFSELYFTSANLTSNLSNLSNTVEAYVGDLYLQLGETNDKSNVAANLALYAANTANATKAIANTVNSAWNLANSAYDYANGTVIRTNAIYSLTNASFNVANAAFAFANSLPLAGAIINAAAAFDQANLAFQLAGEAFDMANAVYLTVAGCVSNTTSAYNFANGVSVNVASAYRVINAAFGVANSGYNTTNSVYYKTNSCYVVTNSAYNTANSKINTANGTATGTFTSQGDVYVYGNTTLSSGLHSFNLTGGTISKNINIIANVPTSKSTLNFYDASQSTIYSSLTANSVGLYIDSSLMVTGDITAFYGTTSDQRFKTNLEKISNPLEKISQINGYLYNWNDLAKDMKHKDTSKKEVGLLAQELEKVLPEAVATNENGYKGIHYEKVVALLVECIKEQQKQIDELKVK